MSQIKIKASSIHNLTDARYFASKEVEWVGFSLEPGMEGAIEMETAANIIGWIDSVKVVGEFDTLPAEDILEIHEQLWFDAVQVGMFTSPEEMKKLSKLALIQEVVVGKNMKAEELSDYLAINAMYCESFLLNLEKDGFTWESLQKDGEISLKLLRQIARQYQIILALDFTAGNISQVLEAVQPFGISLVGGAEERTGVKSFDELDDIFEELGLPAHN